METLTLSPLGWASPLNMARLSNRSLDIPPWLFNKQLTLDIHQAQLSVSPPLPPHPALPPSYTLPHPGQRYLDSSHWGQHSGDQP